MTGVPSAKSSTPVGRVLPQDRLELRRLAQAVDAAVGEDAAAQHRLALAQVEVGAELPRRDALVPVAARCRRRRRPSRPSRETPAPRTTPSGFLSAVAGASATPSSLVVPRQKVVLSLRTIETAAPATGAPVSSRVTNTSVFCGLSFTVRPRFVTCTIDARVGAPVADRARWCGRGCGRPSRPPTPGRCRPATARRRAAARATARDRASRGSWRAVAGASGAAREARSSAAGSSPSAARARCAKAHCRMSRTLRA